MMSIHPIKCSDCKSKNAELREDGEVSSTHCPDCGNNTVSNELDTKECLEAVDSFEDGWVCRSCGTQYFGYLPADIGVEHTSGGLTDNYLCKGCHASG